MDQFRLDLRQSIRLLRATPVLTALAIATLATGIGANATIFSAVSALILRPLPIPDADRLVFGVSLREGFDPFGTSLLDYLVFRNAVEFSSTGVALQRPVNVIDHEADRYGAERIVGADVSGTYFPTLEIRPMLGRTIDADDDRPGAAATAVIGHDLWRRRFGGRANAIGQTLMTADGPMTVVGVMPRGFDQPAHAEVWIPTRLNFDALPITQQAAHSWTMIARLRPGARMSAVNGTLRALAQQIEREHPQLRRGWTYEVISMRRELAGDIEGRTDRALAVLVVAVGFLLLICCVNVAGLLLVRGISRQREIAVRLALGGSRRRILRQLLTESALLAAIAAGAGLLLASWMLPVVAALNPIRASALGDFLLDFRIDARVLGFTTALSLASASLFGILPAMKTIGSSDLAAALKQREQRMVNLAGQRWLDALVVVEIAVAAVLLVGGSLVVQSFQRLRVVELGFRPERVLTLQTALAPSAYGAHTERTAFVDRLLTRLRGLPGVDAAGVSTNLPLDDLSFDSVFSVEGRPPSRPGDVPITAHRLVSAGYLETIGVRLVRGRLIDARDRADSTPVVVVTQEFARLAWPGEENPVGRHVRRGSWDQTGFPWLTVVGVIADTKEDQFNFRIARPGWYLPYSQLDTTTPIKIAVRASGDPVTIAGAVREAAREIDPNQPLTAMRPLSDQVDAVTARDRFSAVLVGWLALIGVAFATCGLYGVVAYTVSRRRGEFGLRLALGAQPTDIRDLVLRRGAWLACSGVIAGLLAARGLARVLSSTLYDVRPGDPSTFAGVAILVATVGLLACYLPARRAGSVDPAIALRD